MKIKNIYTNLSASQTFTADFYAFILKVRVTVYFLWVKRALTSFGVLKFYPKQGSDSGTDQYPDINASYYQ